jgi:AraC-like DNA-binding protein
MHQLRNARPCLELRPYVRAYAQRQTGIADPLVIEVTPAQLEQILEFDFGSTFDIWHSDGRHQVCDEINIVGSQTSFARVQFASRVESFAIFFQPTGFWRLFGVPPSELADRGGTDATAVLGSSVRMLWNHLGESLSFEDRVRIAESFLLDRLARALHTSHITLAADYLFYVHGTVRIVDLARANGLGLRQFERLFLRDLGIAPKVFGRIARFQAALDTKIAHPIRSWLEIAHALEYHDQMHMIHDFEKLGGTAPSKFLAQLGNMRPPALASSG